MQGFSVPGICPRGSLSRMVSLQDGLFPGVSVQEGSLSVGFSVQKGSLSRGISVQEEVSVWGASVLGLSVQGGFCPEGLSPGQKPKYGEQ